MTVQGADGALLALVQWLSPAFPTGAFACSHGFETAIATGEIADAQAARDWIADVLRFGSGRTDAILLSLALRPGSDHAALADLARALAATAERLAETEDLGAALARTIGALQGQPVPPLPFPVALGRAASGLGLPPALVIGLSLQAFGAMLVSVAVRLVPIGQTEGQAILSDLAPMILELAEEAAVAPHEAIGAGAFRADIAAAQHETLDVRLFRT